MNEYKDGYETFDCLLRERIENGVLSSSFLNLLGKLNLVLLSLAPGGGARAAR